MGDQMGYLAQSRPCMCTNACVRAAQGHHALVYSASATSSWRKLMPYIMSMTQMAHDMPVVKW